MEFIIDLIKQLQNTELCIDQAREKLILRCPEFNNKLALKLFDPPDTKEENMHQHNVKRAFRQVSIPIESH